MSSHHLTPVSLSLAATLTPGTPVASDYYYKDTTSIQLLSNPSSYASSSSSYASSDFSTTSSEDGGSSSIETALGECSLVDVICDEDQACQGDYGSAERHKRAKEAARILLSQCLLDDNPRYYCDAASMYDRGSRLGLAPITLLLNPETPCPTKIIPLPDSSSSIPSKPVAYTSSNLSSSTSSSSSSYSLDDEDDDPSSNIEEQTPSRFMRLL